MLAPAVTLMSKWVADKITAPLEQQTERAQRQAAEAEQESRQAKDALAKAN